MEEPIQILLNRAGAMQAMAENLTDSRARLLAEVAAADAQIEAHIAGVKAINAAIEVLTNAAA